MDYREFKEMLAVILRDELTIEVDRTSTECSGEKVEIRIKIGDDQVYNETLDFDCYHKF